MRKRAGDRVTGGGKQAGLHQRAGSLGLSLEEESFSVTQGSGQGQAGGLLWKPAKNWTSHISQIKSSWSLLLVWVLHFPALFLWGKLIVFLILLLLVSPSSTIFPSC